MIKNRKEKDRVILAFLQIQQENAFLFLMY